MTASFSKPSPTATAPPPAGREAAAERRITLLTFAAVVAIALAGAAVLHYAMRWGAGLTPDSATYLRYARELQTHGDLTVFDNSGKAWPLTRFPPLYPAVLAGLGRVFGDPQAAARGFQCALLAINTILFALLIHQNLGRCKWLGAVAALWFVASPDMLNLHAMLWSEGLCLSFLLAGWILLARHLTRPRALFAGGAAVAVGLALLTRYAAGAALIAGAIVLLFRGRKTRRGNVLDAIGFSVAAAAPSVAWMIRNRLVSDAAAGRQFAVHFPPAAELGTAVKTAIHWLAPFNHPAAVVAIVLIQLALVVAAVILWRRVRTRAAAPQNSLLPVLAVFAATYLAFVGATRCFFDANTPLDWRILSPALVAGAAMATISLGRIVLSSRLAAVVIAAELGLLILGPAVWRSVSWVIETRNEGLDYACPRWRNSETLTWLRRNVPENAAIYANGYDVVYLITGRSADLLPAKFDPSSRVPNGDFDRQVQEMRPSDGRPVFIVITATRRRDYLPTEKELGARLPLRQVQKADGTIYRIAPATEP